MKKVGIVTFQYNNYGTKLQNLAMILALKNLGVEPRSIYIKHRKDTYKSILRDLIKYPLGLVIKKRQTFSSFSKQQLCLHMVRYSELAHIQKQYDYFIAGSDQIWNPQHLMSRPKDINLFFLQFAPKAKRIAYAPSFGVDKLDIKDFDLYKRNIMEFASLSVREKAGQKALKNIPPKKTNPVVPDPTFLLSKSDWLSIAKPFNSALYNNKKYVLVYFLSSQEKKIKDEIDYYASSSNLTTICIAGDIYIDKNSIVPSPDELLWLISNAQAVITDSFHGAVFSIITEVPFVTCARTDVRQHNRINNLLETFRLQFAFYDGDRSIADIINKFNDISSTQKLLEIQKTGIQYLKTALSTQDEK